jgi:hypothetical protein
VSTPMKKYLVKNPDNGAPINVDGLTLAVGETKEFIKHQAEWLVKQYGFLTLEEVEYEPVAETLPEMGIAAPEAPPADAPEAAPVAESAPAAEAAPEVSPAPKKRASKKKTK